MSFWLRPAFLLLAALSPMPVPASAPDDTLIRSAEQLAARLRNPAPSPLSDLSPGARERLPSGVAFTAKGVAGLDSTDFGTDLDPAQCRAALAMFMKDAEDYANAVCSASPRDHTAAAQRKTGISEIERRYNRFYTRAMGMMPGDDLDRARILATAHAEELPPLDAKGLHALGDGDLDLLLRAALTASRFSADHSLGNALLGGVFRIRTS